MQGGRKDDRELETASDGNRDLLVTEEDRIYKYFYVSSSPLHGWSKVLFRIK
jgi:hypothetical protein